MYEIKKFVTGKKSCPFDEWMEILDKKTRGRIHAKLANVRSGNIGDVESLGKGLFEMRLHFGSGYRIYFYQEKDVITLISGGDKGTQTKDIKHARACLE